MNQFNERFKRLGLFILAALITISLAIIPFFTGDEIGSYVYAEENNASAPRVQHHSEAEIINFIKSHPASENIDYEVKPNWTKAPYSAGKLSAGTQQSALNALNQYRYIAGLSSDVSLDQGHMQSTQSATLINAVNGGLSHYPNEPAGMSDELYQSGAEGASSSNLAAGYPSLASAIDGWVSDSDPGNFSQLGHRRWCLNPSMRKTVFGFTNGVSAMYAFDGAFNDAGQDSMWPAENTPIQYISDDLVWSFSTGEEEDKGKISVLLKDVTNGQQWRFSNSSNSASFNVDNDNYGMIGCILFRPEKANYASGEKFSVTISGTQRGTISYTVNLFDLDGDTVKMYRAYNPYSGEHFYTSNRSEFDHLVSLGWRNEGIGWIAPAKSNTPVYRLYNKYGGEHHYTTNIKERNNLIKAGWRNEGIGWYSDDQKRTPLYREYNPYAYANNHNYTTSKEENDFLVYIGWKYEGVGWYGIRAQ